MTVLNKTLRGKQLLYELDKAHEEGWLNRQFHKDLPLVIYCYAQEAMFKQHWTRITKFARGVVLDKNTGNIVTKPFTKFFNYGERFCHPPKRGDYMSFDKIDGSLLSAAWYEPEQRWLLTTKGSFENEYIDFASTFVHLFDNMPKDHTIICEVVLPVEADGMKRAVVHEPGLYLLGMTDMKDLSDKPIGMMYGTWQGHWPKTYSNSIDELVQESNSTVGTEGWVIRFSNGYRIKVKTTWYLKVFRALSNLDKQVQEQMIAGKDIDEILFDMPEELHEDIKDYYQGVMEWVQSESEKALLTFEEIRHAIDYDRLLTKDSRKAFAREAVKDPRSALLFKLLDGKDITQMLIEKAIKDGMN